MQIEADTYFVKHHIHNDDEYIFLSHYQEVWDSGYTVDDYLIDTEDIYYEDACHSGVNPKTRNAGTYIMKKQYLRWTKHIQEAKETAIRMLEQSATPITRNLEEGDIILYTWIDDEDEIEFREDNEYCGMKIVEFKDDRLFVQGICIGTHSFDSRDEIWSPEEDDILSSSNFITAEAFIATHDYMRNFCRQLLEEIKSHTRITELSRRK